MDARERLRQFLEQRRDLGESEFVLDSMSVDDAMRILGAASARQLRADSLPLGSVRPAAGRADAAPVSDRGLPAASADWREALRGADAPSSAAKRPAVPPPPVRTHTLRTDAERAPAPPVSREGAPEPIAAGNREQVRDSLREAEPRLPNEGPTDDYEGGDDMTARKRSATTKTPKDVAESHRGDKTDASNPPAKAKISLDEVPAGLVVGSAAHELFDGKDHAFTSLDAVADAVQHCRLCKLYATAKQGVPGEGNAKAELVCVGEAPGANEDETGRPFVGQAGQLLTKILAAIDLAREDVFIVNVLKHRPPGNRNPLPDEVTACSPYLVRQIELIGPKVIVAFGTFAAQTLLQTKEPIGKLRGRIHRYHGVPLIVTYHPAALLRNPAWKRPTWEDVQLARRLLDRSRDA